MQRKIIGYHLDEDGDWVAELDCHHGQHLRHQPPFINRPWVITADGRQAMLGAALNCVRCDRLEQPEDLPLLQRTPECTETSLPEELRLGYATRAGIWTRLVLLQGHLHCRLEGALERTLELEPLETLSIPPEVLHAIVPRGPVRFYLEYCGIPTGENTSP